MTPRERRRVAIYHAITQGCRPFTPRSYLEFREDTWLGHFRYDLKQSAAWSGRLRLSRRDTEQVGRIVAFLTDQTAPLGTP